MAVALRLLEGLPAVIMGLALLFILPNGPQHVGWLSVRQKAWLRARLAEEAVGSRPAHEHRFMDVVTSGRVWLLCLLYFLMNIGSYGYELWLPSIIKSFSGKSDAIVGWINAIPYVIAAIVMLLVGRYSDRTGGTPRSRRGGGDFFRGGICPERVIHQSLSRAGVAGAGLCRDQVHHRAVLGAHDVVPHGPGRRRRHRADQFRRQSRWLRRALRRRHDQGSYG